MRYVYGVLSIAGLILPMVCFGIHFTRAGERGWPEFWAAPFATWVISGFSWDLMLTATACTFWMANESKRLKIKGFAWHFVAIFLVGICFALPTFLYRREAYLKIARATTIPQQP
jgi:FtsH-binding integral membrane protein